MLSTDTFCRQVRSRSNEHQRAMQLLSHADLAGQMVAVLRQELDSMVRVIYLLAQPTDRRNFLIDCSVNGERWSQQNSMKLVTDKEIVELAQSLLGWTLSVYKFGCAFIHLSNMHDYNDRDPYLALPQNEQDDLLQHCRQYHGGPSSNEPEFPDFVPYFPSIFEKIAGNLECYLVRLESGAQFNALEV